MSDHSNLTDKEVREEWERKANALSGYNAAEGNMWYSEREARHEANKAFNLVNAELKSRELDRPAGSYLL